MTLQMTYGFSKWASVAIRKKCEAVHGQQTGRIYFQPEPIKPLDSLPNGNAMAHLRGMNLLGHKYMDMT